MRRIVLAAAVVVATGLPAQSPPRGAAPAELVGAFRDDYGSDFLISDSVFAHLPRSRYRVVEWNVAERFLVAQNDALNASDAGRWTRIDWMPFTGMEPFTWGFCLTAYKASSEAEARATTPADRTAPRTGCNGYPFSRMQRREAPEGRGGTGTRTGR